MTELITIIGLDRIGISLGMAIKKKEPSIVCAGFDQNQFHTRMAGEKAAFDRIENNLHKAVEKADIVILNSLSLDVTEWMADISRSMKEGAILVSMAPVHALAGKWAEENLPEGRWFINATFSINGRFLDDEECSADLFTENVMILSAPPNTHEDAVQKILDLAAIVGANPMFSDPVEADGFLSQSDLFPRIVNLMVLQGLKKQSGWSDAQKMTGSNFWNLSKMLFEFSSGESVHFEMKAHKANMLSLLDMLRDQIDSMQETLESDDDITVTKSIQKMLDEHNVWMTRRKTGKWDAKEAEEEAKPKGIWHKLFGIRTPGKKS